MGLRDESQALSALVVGGSLGGLFTALLLKRVGWRVDVFEHSPGRLDSRGGGVVLQPEVVRAFDIAGLDIGAILGVDVDERVFLDRCGSILQRLPMRQTLTSWSALYNAMRDAIADASYHQGETLIHLVQRPDRVEAQFESGRVEAGQLLIGADGRDSTVRTFVAPAAKAEYAGYVAYRGIVDEGVLSDRSAEVFVEKFTFQTWYGSHILQYLIPGQDGHVAPGRRRFNWVWYVNRDERKELPRVLTDRAGTMREKSVPPGLMSDETRSEMLDLAEQTLSPQFLELVRATPAPFIQPIVDLSVENMFTGRVALVGDAAFVPRPHTAASTAKAAANAIALAESLLHTAHDIDAALRIWEPAQLRYGAQLRIHGQRLGDHSQFPDRRS